MTVTGRRRAQLAAGLAVIGVIVGLLIWAAAGDDDGEPASAPITGATSPAGTTADGRPASAPTTGGPGPARATGRGTCAFLSTDDIAKAAEATKVELRQTQGPGGNPACEWVLGDQRAPLQLEFVDAAPGPAPTLPGGEDVQGPWESARWVAGTRTLHVKAPDVSLIVRASESDPARAKTVATNVALLAMERT